MTNTNTNTHLLSGVVLGVLVSVVALGLALIVAGGTNEGGLRAQSGGCDSSDPHCVRETATAEAVRDAIDAAALTARQDAWSEAGATLAAERDYLFGQIQTANARLDGAFMPSHCYEYEVGSFPYEFEAVAALGADYDRSHHEGLRDVFKRVALDCMKDAAVAMHVIIGPSATAISAAQTATALAEAE